MDRARYSPRDSLQAPRDEGEVHLSYRQNGETKGCRRVGSRAQQFLSSAQPTLVRCFIVHDAIRPHYTAFLPREIYGRPTMNLSILATSADVLALSSENRFLRTPSSAALRPVRLRCSGFRPSCHPVDRAQGRSSKSICAATGLPISHPISVRAAALSGREPRLDSSGRSGDPVAYHFPPS